jgi:hypothetical protein
LINDPIKDGSAYRGLLYFWKTVLLIEILVKLSGILFGEVLNILEGDRSAEILFVGIPAYPKLGWLSIIVGHKGTSLFTEDKTNDGVPDGIRVR